MIKKIRNLHVKVIFGVYSKWDYSHIVTYIPTDMKLFLFLTLSLFTVYAAEEVWLALNIQIDFLINLP